MLGGAVSHRTLDKLGAIRRWAGDPGRPAAIRDKAAEAVAAIDRGAPVDPSHAVLTRMARSDDLGKTAADETEPDQVREAAREGVSRLRALQAGGQVSEQALGRAAEAAWERVKQARGQGGERRAGGEGAASCPPEPKRRGVAHFVWTWREMADWPAGYDPDQIAEALTRAQWESFKQTMAAADAFTGRVAEVRSRLGLDA
jgi:hypothetical protein